MTNDEKQSIYNMRRNGASYAVIAATLNLSKSTVASFCQKEGLRTGSSKALTALRYCKYCGKPLPVKEKGKEQKFCSEHCRMSWWKEHPKDLNKKAIYIFTCPCCGKTFTSYGNAHRKYCSHACYIQDRFGGSHED